MSVSGSRVAPSGYRLTAPSGIRGRLAAPTSKSITNRALVLAGLARGTSLLRRPLESDDTAHMEKCLRALGAGIQHEPSGWRITGTTGRPASPEHELDAGLSGTTMRFLAACLALTPSGGTITGQPGLLRRPVGDLTAALRALGADVDDQGGFPPLTVLRGKPIGGSVVVDAAQSSQFATAVLLVAPCAARETRVRVEHLGNPGYVELTLDSMRTFGATFSQEADGTVVVPPGQTYAARDLELEFDASAAMHLLALAVASGGRVTIENARVNTLQPDMQLLAVFERMGARVQREADGVTVYGPARLLACDADLSAMPDQVLTLAALAAVAQGTSTISNVALVRGHETDRLAAAATELRRLGAEVEELPDGLRIHGSEQVRPARIATYGDHRVAMAFAALAGRVPGIVIDDPGCVSKTYPGFWQDAAGLGLQILSAQ